MGCQYCDELEFPRRRVYYQDKLCVIVHNGLEVLGIYRWHFTPKPKHAEWIDLQMKIIASRKWDKDWTLKFDNYDHPFWLARPLPNKEFRKSWKKYEPQNKTKEIPDEG
jgi:hypothetical protein